MSKILIIEDEETIRRVLNKVLSEENKDYIIVEAIDGLQAIDIVKSNKIDLILCDIKMPKKDGIDVLKFLIKDYSCDPRSNKLESSWQASPFPCCDESLIWLLRESATLYSYCSQLQNTPPPIHQLPITGQRM